MNVYDFDGTIYHGDSTLDFFLYSLRRYPTLIKHIPFQVRGYILYKFGKLTKTQFKECFFQFLADIDTDKMVTAFWKQNNSRIYLWYKKQQKQDDIIISASPEFLLRPLCQQLGVQCLIASKVDESSGKFIGENCKGMEKVHRLVAEFGNCNIDNFYSDSVSDLPLAKLAKHAFLVRNGMIIPWQKMCQ